MCSDFPNKLNIFSYSKKFILLLIYKNLYTYTGPGGKVLDDSSSRTMYNLFRIPQYGVYINTDDDFLVGCNCIDDCQDSNK